MATTKYLLLINNHIVRTSDNSPIFEEKLTNGTVAYFSRRLQSEAGDKVVQFMESLQQQEMKDPIYDAVSGDTQNTVRYNDQLHIKTIYTPLYLLKTKVAMDDTKTIVPGKGIDVADDWREMRYSFFIEEFLKFSQIMDYMEGTIAKRRPKFSAFTIKSSGNRVMNLVHVVAPGLFNPLLAIKGFEDTKFFKGINGTDESLMDFNEPAIFGLPIIRGTTMAYFATSSDVMMMLGMKHKESINSRDLYRLIAGTILKIMFPSPKGKFTTHVLNLPTSRLFYTTEDISTGDIFMFYNTIHEAREAANRTTTLDAKEYDPNKRFIASAFPSLKGTSVTNETPLLHDLGGADFV